MDNNENNLSALIISYLDGEADAETRRRVEEWRDESDENRVLFRNLAQAVADCRALGMYAVADTDRAWKLFARNMGWRRSRTFAVLRNIAAVMALPLLALSLYFALSGTSRFAASPQMVEMHTGAGMTGRVVLSDSTVVILNACSSLRYPAHFTEGSRKVELSGVAYFEVTKDEARRFTVALGNGDEVNVYGTTFTVEAFPGSDNFTTTLVEGRIGYRYTDGKGVRREQILAPEQKLTRDNCGTISLAAADTDFETAWVKNKIVLNSTSLEQILQILGKKYDVSFDVSAYDGAGRTFSGGEITISSLGNVLEALSISADFRWRYRHNDDSLSTKPIIEIY